MLETVGAASLDQLIDQVIPASIRLPKPLALPPAESESTYLARLDTLARRNTRRPQLHRSRVLRHADAECHQALPVRESRLVHALHAVSGGDRPGPPRVAPQFPDARHRSHGHGGGQRLAARRRHGGGRGDGAAAPRPGQEGGRSRGRVPGVRSRVPADARRAAKPRRTARHRAASRPGRGHGLRRPGRSARSCSIRTRPVVWTTCGRSSSGRTPPACSWRSPPTCSPWPSSRRPERWAPTSCWATRSASACRSGSAGRTPRSSPLGRTTCATCPGASSA